MLKSPVCVVLVWLLIPSIGTCGLVEYKIRPFAGTLLPTDDILRDYYDRWSVFLYGVDLGAVTDWHALGLYLTLQRHSFKVVDRFNEREYVEDIGGIWYTFGVQKFVFARGSSLYGRFGTTFHSDNLGRESSDVRFGLRPGLGFEANITRWTAFFFEVAYEYEMLSVSDYVTSQYSRHQTYLAGREFQTGGLLFLTGISLSYPAREKRN